MRLVIPKSLNNAKSEKYTLKKLWLHPDNIKYNKVQIYYGVRTLDTQKNIAALLKDNLKVLDFVDDFMSDFSDPYFANKMDCNKNVLFGLHEANKEFIISTSREIISNPGLLDENYGYNFYGEVEKIETAPKTIDDGAFTGGYYQPEKLFASKMNYWQPLDVSIDFTKCSVYNRLTDGPEQGYTGTNVRLYEVFKRNYAPLDNRAEELTAYPSRMGY